MTDQETAQFVHQALFRAPAAELSATIHEYLADALYDTATRAQISRVPEPMGSPTAQWLFSYEVKQWLESAGALKYDLAAYVSAAYQPVSPAATVRRTTTRRR